MRYRRLAIAALGGVALAGFGMGRALSSEPPFAFAHLSAEDLRLCLVATTEAGGVAPAPAQPGYRALARRLYAVTPSERPEALGHRTRMVQNNLAADQVVRLAQACRTALETGQPLRNPVPAQTDGAELMRVSAAGSGKGNTANLQSFHIDEATQCRAAAVVVWSVTEGDKYYNKASWQFSDYYDEGLERANARTKMLKAYLSEAEIKWIADLCIGAMITGAKYRNPLGDRGGQADYYRWVEANPLPKSEPYTRSAPAATVNTAALIQSCDAELERVRAESMQDFRNAQRGVETYLKTGVRFGFSYIRDGCVAIDRGLSKLGGMSCPATYTDALQRYRNDYYIGMPDGSRLQCN